MSKDMLNWYNVDGDSKGDTEVRQCKLLLYATQLFLQSHTAPAHNRLYPSIAASKIRSITYSNVTVNRPGNPGD